jgi:hypothetical protein
MIGDAFFFSVGGAIMGGGSSGAILDNDLTLGRTLGRR